LSTIGRQLSTIGGKLQNISRHSIHDLLVSIFFAFLTLKASHNRQNERLSGQKKLICCASG
jgi:hypothetical protein